MIPFTGQKLNDISFYLTPWVLKGALIGILEVDTKVGLEIKYVVIFSLYFLIYVKNTMEIFYKSIFFMKL